MSFLNLVGKRLQPARKAWKILTTKLNSKLHKLNTSKSIKKPKTRVNALSFQPRLHRKRRTNSNPIQPTHVLLRRRHHHHRLQIRSAPVYIDDLFIEPPVSVETTSSSKQGLITDKCSTGTETAKLCDHRPAGDAPGTSKEADDMWESLGLASPLMHGINERAEEFIARIRAEMQLQETMVRRL